MNLMKISKTVLNLLVAVNSTGLNSLQAGSSPQITPSEGYTYMFWEEMV